MTFKKRGKHAATGIRASRVKRVTGVDLDASVVFLRQACLIKGQGFSSQYAGQQKVSCATSATCIYALAQMGTLTRSDKEELIQLLLSFRQSLSAGAQGGAFPRTSGSPSTWATAQAILALTSIGASCEIVQPSLEWLLDSQGPTGGWNFPGTTEGNERAIYTFYPTLALLRYRRQLGKRALDALARVTKFLQQCEERSDPWWLPLQAQLQHTITPSRDRGALGRQDFTSYWELFEDGWPKRHVDDDWLPDRFHLGLLCGANYLHLRRLLPPDDPLPLLHIRQLADECIENGWNDNQEDRPKSWATALGALTLVRWDQDLARVGRSLTKLPTRLELLDRLRTGQVPRRLTSPESRALLQRHARLSLGTHHATQYQAWLRDVFTFLFGDALKEPKTEVRTFLGTQRRDITFRNAAAHGPWCDWKQRHQTDSVVIECKNKQTLSYNDLRQAACYLGNHTGRLGIIASRFTTPDDVREMLNWFITNDQKYLLVVNDEQLLEWIRRKDRGEDATESIADVYRCLREQAQ